MFDPYPFTRSRKLASTTTKTLQKFGMNHHNVQIISVVTKKGNFVKSTSSIVKNSKEYDFFKLYNIFSKNEPCCHLKITVKVKI